MSFILWLLFLFSIFRSIHLDEKVRSAHISYVIQLLRYISIHNIIYVYMSGVVYFGLEQCVATRLGLPCVCVGVS